MEICAGATQLEGNKILFFANQSPADANVLQFFWAQQHAK